MVAELGSMVALGLAPMTAAGFLKDLTNSVIVDVENHVLGVDRLRVVVNRRGGNELIPIAFLASNVKKVSLYSADDNIMLHVGGEIVDGPYQNRGIGPDLIKSELAHTNATLLGGHTQNLHALKMLEGLADYELGLSNTLAQMLGTPNPEIVCLDDGPKVVHVGRYGDHSLYGDLKHFRQQQSVIKGLNYENGDAVVFVGQIKEVT